MPSIRLCFRDKDLDPKAEEFIVGWAEDLPHDATPALVVDLDREAGYRMRRSDTPQKHGNVVIVGRGAQHFLRDRSDTLRFFLYARRETKIRRLVIRGKAKKEARR